MRDTPLASTLFISHGAPTFAVEPGALGQSLLRYAGHQVAPRAVLVISPHWQTTGWQVMTSVQPVTVHDFGGFPDALYRLQHPAAGAPDVAREVLQTLRHAGYTATEDAQRGLDHGAWVPLMHLNPGAEWPVLQLSMPLTLDAAGALALGRALAPLRAHGVMIVGSGSMTHNLYEFRGPGVPTQGYVTAFAQWVRAVVQQRDWAALQDYRRRAPAAERAHPTDEHFLPLLVAAGASAASDALTILETEVRYGMLSMESYAWGGVAT